MEDRFKFRAWVKGQGAPYSWDGYKMIYPELDLTSIKDHFDLSRFVFSDGQIDGNYHTAEVVMQCTGLKDKNGKLIYESDILEGPPPWKEAKPWIFEIFWGGTQRELGGFERRWLKGEALSVAHADGEFYARACSIVGNVYENPELLSQTS